MSPLAPPREIERSASKGGAHGAKKSAQRAVQLHSMEHSTTWTRAVVRTSEIQGSLLLANATILLIGAWATFGVAALPSEERESAALHPLALEEWHDACDGGDLVACNDLGVAYQHGYGADADSDLALELFGRACRTGHAEACSNRGAMLEQSWQRGQDIAPIRDAYTRACDGRSGLGCSNLGALYAIGKGVPRHAATARWYFDRACQLGSPIGCENQALLSEREARRAPSKR
jgi:Sel1 repeat